MTLTLREKFDGLYVKARDEHAAQQPTDDWMNP